jgi:selenocysteine-specific elongation factor
MILVGTSGHVDHGKSTLVEALTGINPVHLPEEFERGLTIELGFAHIPHPDGYVLGIVDVPGHERLVRTMISGATGFQLALWVIDAREGVMPQSLEHLEVLDLLGAARVLPVVTKADLATEDQVAATVAAAEAELEKTGLGRFPTQVVDSVSGRGIDALRNALFEACRSLETDPERLNAPAFMPIDRSFVLKGVGTVVTGTLVRGRLEAGTSVETASAPGDAWRIRSLHNHNTQVAAIAAGHRVGVQLHGVRPGGVARGDILVAADYPYRSDRLNAELRLLPGKTFRLKHGVRALFLAASYEMECRLWGARESGGRLWAQVQLPQETCFYPEERFVLRSTNPLATVGGGIVRDLEPDRLRRLTDPELALYGGGDLADYVRASGGIFEAGELEVRWMRPEGSVQADVGKDPALGTTETRIGKRDVRLVWHEDLTRRALTHLGALASAQGSGEQEWSFSEVAKALGFRTVYARAFLEWILARNEAARFQGHFTLSANTLRYDPEKGGLSETEQRVADALLGRLAADDLRPSRLSEYAGSSGAQTKTFDKVVSILLKSGALVRIDNEFVLARDAWLRLRQGLLELPEAGVTPAEFGRHFDLTRKYSMPFIECFNKMGFMRREGSRHRILRDRVSRSLSPGP